MTTGNKAGRRVCSTVVGSPPAYHGLMSISILLRAILIQAIAVGALFALLLALPLPTSLFREQGAWIGPLSWLACALVTARVIGLGPARALGAAATSGLAALTASLAAGHGSAMVVGVVVFGLACAVRIRRSSDAERSGDLRPWSFTR